MCSFKSIYFVIFILNLYETFAEISDKRLCVDSECKEPVSLAKTLLRYSSPDPRILSFAPNAEVTIYSKEAGSETSLWGAVINGKRGYVPKHLVRELKIYKKPTLLVDTELKQSSQVPNETDQSINPNSVKKPYEVVDGTTIYLNPQDSVNPTSTESPLLSTALPVDNNIREQQTIPVDNAKEKEVPTKGSEQQSVVDNVLSSFSKWMDDDTESEELDAEDDEEDGDEDEEDEEDSLEEDVDTKTSDDATKVAQDINSLHNLPPEVKISPYNLEIDQPLNGTIDMSNEEIAEQVSKESESSVSGQKQEPEVTISETVNTLHQEEKSLPTNDAEIPVAKQQETEQNRTSKEETKENEQLASTVESEKIQEVNPVTNSVESEQVEVNQVASTVEPEKAPELNPIEPKTNDQSNNVKDNDNTNAEENTASVTEPPMIAEEIPSPILDGVTTPSPLNTEEQKNLEAEVIADTSSQEVLKNKDQTTDSSAASSDEVSDPTKSTLEEPVTLAPETGPVAESSPSESVVEQQNPIPDEKSKSFIPLPPLSLFAPSSIQSEVSEENKETKNEENTADGLNDASESQTDNHDANSETKVEIEENTASEVSDTSQNEIKNTFEDQVKYNLPPEDVHTVTEPQENIENSVQEETVNNDKINEENKEETKDDSKEEHGDDKINEENKEGIKDDSKEESQNDDTNKIVETPPQEPVEDSENSGGIWSGLFSFVGGSSDESDSSAPNEEASDAKNTIDQNVWTSQHGDNDITSESYCDTTLESCNTSQQGTTIEENGIFENIINMKFNTDFFLLLVTTAGSVIIFLFVYMALDRHKREAPLVARINKLEKELLITLKENELLQEKGTSAVQEIESIPNDVVEQLTQRLAEAQFSQQVLEEKVADLEKQLEAKAALEEQIESLEKELEISTEVGMELNRIISEMLDPTNGSDKLKENMEQLQRQLLEQKDVINTISETLREKEAENRTLRVDLERSKKVATNLQSKVDELVEKILKIEKEKDQQQATLQNEIAVYQQKYSEAVTRDEILNNDNQIIRLQLSEAQRQADIKTKEYHMLKESLDKMKSLKNDKESLKALLDATSIKAEIQQLKTENTNYAAQLQQEQAVKVGFEKKYQAAVEEISLLKEKFDQADKEKVEVNSKLEVLNNYFKKRESELQEEIIRYKSIWDAKEGEATSTTERMRYLQEEIENYKAQNETLKQEIISQEIDLKSQISVLEKKVHENWVTARQTERKLEDARQEAAQLRNRLTLRERAINEERIQNRLQSPVELNGELPLSPHPIDSPASPPLLYGSRDHITKSPPIPGLPPPFLPPPPGAPFMPPPLHGMPHFMPPPPSMFPGDHRPPPLGRMSSPPLNSRYSPDTSAFSPYDRNSPSPPYDSEYGASPPPMRGYSPYNSRDDRRDYKRPPHIRSNGRNAKGSVMSSGSDRSNDSLDKINRKQSKMV